MQTQSASELQFINLENGLEKNNGNKQVYHLMLRFFDKYTLDQYVQQVYDDLIAGDLNNAKSNIRQIVNSAIVIEATGLSNVCKEYERNLLGYLQSEQAVLQKDAIIQFNNLLNEILSFKNEVEAITGKKTEFLTISAIQEKIKILYLNKQLDQSGNNFGSNLKRSTSRTKFYDKELLKQKIKDIQLPLSTTLQSFPHSRQYSNLVFQQQSLQTQQYQPQLEIKPVEQPQQQVVTQQLFPLQQQQIPVEQFIEPTSKMSGEKNSHRTDLRKSLNYLNQNLQSISKSRNLRQQSVNLQMEQSNDNQKSQRIKKPIFDDIPDEKVNQSPYKQILERYTIKPRSDSAQKYINQVSSSANKLQIQDSRMLKTSSPFYLDTKHQLSNKQFFMNDYKNNRLI